MERERETYEIGLDGKWSLEDFYVFPRAFEQVYFLMYSLSTDLDEYELDRVQHAFSAFPWQGGYSAVNFYNQLKYTIPRDERPQVVSIEYSSPGALTLGLLIMIALNVQHLVKIVSGTIKEANHTYTDIVKEMQKRKLLRLKRKRAELDLQRDELEFIEECVKRLATTLEITNLSGISVRTGSPYRTLKILLSLYRRVRVLAEYQIKSKANFMRPQASPKRLPKKR